MQIPVEDIKVRKRIRKDMGDLGALAESMKRLGQISPITLSKQNELIAGGRRLAAAKSLGWKTISAVIVDLPEKLSRLEYEVEENLYRQDLNDDEISKASREICKLRNPGFFRRLWNSIAAFFRRIFNISP
ncbi:MAG: ParB N-terminal domain-containing protein [Treponema sp.]|jgi:ParB family chromosome partitioning protein|nr:ParB N-terminal domain-containing protein [Treponema sp.]